MWQFAPHAARPAVARGVGGAVLHPGACSEALKHQMARLLGPRHKICRRLGQPICGSDKCPALRRSYRPGQHGQQGRRTKLSEYGRQLEEKQKLRYTYGIMERQFRNYFRRALKARGRTGEMLLQMLETRLDNLVYRLGFARSLPQARQLVTHGHVTLNGRKVNIPSHPVQPGDVIAIREKSRDLDVIRAALESRSEVPPYLERDVDTRSGRLLRIPARDEIPVRVDETLVVEFYSR